MDLLEKVFSIILSNYYIYFFIIPFLLISFIVLNKRYGKLLDTKEKTGCYIVTLFFDLIWSNAIVWFISRFELSNQKKIFFILLFVIISIILSLVYSLLYLRIKTKVLTALSSGFIKKRCAGFVFFIFLVAKYIFTMPSDISYWHAWSYATDYSFGFSSRFLAGQILTFIKNGTITEDDIFFFCFFAGLVLLFIVSILFNILINSTDKSCRTAVIYIGICFICCPGNVISLFCDENMGKLETFGLIASLIGVMLFNIINNLYLKYGIVTLLGMIGLAFYQGYAFLYYSIILIIMLFDIFDENRIKIKNMVLGVVSVAVNVLTFLYFQIFSKTKYATISDFVDALSKKSNIDICTESINYEYFAPFRESYNLVDGFVQDGNARLRFLVQLIMMIPIISFFLYIILCYIKKTNEEKKNNYSSLKLLLCIMSVCLVIPQFIFNVDWGRWLTAIIINMFFIILYYAYKKDIAMIDTLNKISIKIKIYPIIAMLFIVCLTYVGTLDATQFSEEALRIYGIIHTVIH